MRRNVVFTVLAVFFLLCSCQSKPVAWDDSIPEDQMASVRLVNMKIDSFNGIAVTKFNYVNIPAGEARLGGEVIIYHAGVNFRASGMEFTCMFEAGSAYIVQGGSQDMQWGVSVYKATKYSDVSAENKVAFIPFKNQPTFN